MMTTHSSGLSTRVYRELLEIVRRRAPLHDILASIAALAVLEVPGAELVSVTLVKNGRAWTAAFSGNLAAVLDERQYQDNAGPCLHAAVSGASIFIDDVAKDQSYPEFSRQAARHGIRSVLAIGIPSLQETSGAINLYGRQGAAGFDRDHREVAVAFADVAGIAMLNAAVYEGALAEIVQMREAMASRSVIEQAKGIVMARRRCGEDEAFALLRQSSMQSNFKLRDIARRVVDDVVDEDAVLAPRV